MGYLCQYALGPSYIFGSFLLHFIYIFVNSYEDTFLGLYLRRAKPAQSREGIFVEIADGGQIFVGVVVGKVPTTPSPILTHISGDAHFYRLGEDASFHFEEIGLGKMN